MSRLPFILLVLTGLFYGSVACGQIARPPWASDVTTDGWQLLQADSSLLVLVRSEPGPAQPIKRIEVRLEFNRSAAPAFKVTRSSVDTREVDCSALKYRILEVRNFTGNNMTGDEERFGGSEWQNNSGTENIASTIVKYACSHLAVPRPWGNLPRPKIVGMCVLISKADHTIKDAIVIVPSGDAERDKKVLSSAIGEEVPVPDAWGGDRWFRYWVGEPTPGAPDPRKAAANPCDDLNRRR